MKKPTKREIFLLRILGAVIAGGALIVVLAAVVPGIRETRADIELKEANIRNIQTLRVNEAELGRDHDRLTRAIAAERERYHAPGAQDLTQLGIRMLALIRKNGLGYTRLNKVDSKDGRYLEIALGGSIVNVMRLLKDVSDGPKYLNVISLSLAHKDGKAQATIRMNYGENAAPAP